LLPYGKLATFQLYEPVFATLLAITFHVNPASLLYSRSIPAIPILSLAVHLIVIIPPKTSPPFGYVTLTAGLYLRNSHIKVFKLFLH